MFKQEKPRNHLLAYRRRNEERIEKFENFSRSQKQSEHCCEWEDKMRNRIDNKYILQKVQRYKYLTKEKLNERREKLSRKLKFEENQYIVEIEEKKETPSMRRKRLEDRANELRQQREARSKRFREEQLRRKFIEESDEIRNAKARLNNLVFAKNREGMIREKENHQKLVDDNEEYYSQYLEEQRQKGIERENREKQKVRDNKRKFKNDLMEQQYEIKMEEEQKANFLRLERERLAEQWALADAKAIADKRRRKEEELKIAGDIHEYNKKKNAIREEESRTEKEMVDSMIRRALEKKEEDDRLDLERKIEFKKKQTEYKHQLKLQMEKERTDESELERLRQKEMEAQHRKRDEFRRRDLEARKRLLDEAKEDQLRMIARNVELMKRQEWEKHKEREIVERDVENYLNQEHEKINMRRDRNKRDYNIKQIEMKNERNAFLENEKRLEEQERLRREKEYDEKLGRELRILNQQKPKEYSNISILPKKYRHYERSDYGKFY